MNIIKRCTPAFVALFFILSMGLSSSAHAFCGVHVDDKDDDDIEIERYGQKNDGTWRRSVGQWYQSSIVFKVYKNNDNWFSLQNQNNDDIVWFKKTSPHYVVRKIDGNKNTWWGQRAEFIDSTCNYDYD